ncbi:excinuclease ABC subunit A [Desulfonauticus submarinus]|uniref:UvrABC system protein A n=1 Tax=Desulfonauticus submarinus TaxID=206665 RepID=A0A1H0EC47_9BACT|nr:excinuclease ABC subunit UvrA [Desulfonauticus submarinus]SDN79984.1 excinuclease ABC subunit A [Desulfonauticus submarinus]
MNKEISIYSAHQHNLKNINLNIPKEKLVVICGPSGSGKSTLAFDIIYAEGQRRYVESLSAYARQFLPKLDKPKVKKIEGLSPAIAIEQQNISKNPRSTVGTTTEIYDFLRVLFARVGEAFCPKCGNKIQSQTSDEIKKQILNLPEETKFILLAPLKENQKGSFKELFISLRKQGFIRIRIDGEIYLLDSPPNLDKNKKHTIELVVDRLILKPNIQKRLSDSLELALKMGKGLLKVFLPEPKETLFFSTHAVCPICKISLPTLTPQLFSFNSPQGACPYCSGLGHIDYFDPHLIAPDLNLSLQDKAILPWRKSKILSKYESVLKTIGKHYNFSLNTPLTKYSKKALKALFWGDKTLNWSGVIPILKELFKKDIFWKKELGLFLNTEKCPQCNGTRLKPESLCIKINNLNIFEITNMSIEQLFTFFSNICFSEQKQKIANPLIEEIKNRLKFLINVGLNYISLNRTMSSLSGGEAQRIRLASQLGTGLTGVIYVLDEPTIGLHPKDNKRLLKTLEELKNKGNTVIIVEHDEDTILKADHIIELGPQSGEKGGEVVFTGTANQLKQANTLTGKYLRKELTLPIPARRRKPKHYLFLEGVNTNNLKNINCAIPLNTLTVVTGVSGSGKSSLVIDTLYKHLALKKGQKINNPGKLKQLKGDEYIERVFIIDQSPIGRTPRSNPATYTKVFDDIRQIFANTLDSKKRGYKPSRFSFNLKGGRCEACNGDGQIKVEMHFLPDIYVTCEICKGQRYNKETLEVRYKGLNIAEVLELTVSEAKEIFSNHPAVVRKLQILEDVGLEYLKLGQPATTLSGGEAQRIKLSRELNKKHLPNTLYLLDEPTTGLHMHEVGKLINVLNQLVEKGASVILIEHNIEVIKSADFIIDLGPGGGEFGGKIVATGTPEEIKNNPDSITGKFLKF